MLKLEEWQVKVRPKLMERENKLLGKLVNGFLNIKEVANETIYTDLKGWNAPCN